MSFLRPSYRTRRRWKALGMFLGITAAAALVIWLVWLIWLDRFVVYSRDEARLDFGWSVSGDFQVAEPPVRESVPILYDDGSSSLVEKEKELQRLSGVYITAEMLVTDFAEVDRLVREEPAGSAVLVELKTPGGQFFYPSTVPGTSVSSQVDTAAVAGLVEYLRKSEHYMIAAIPALRDRAYGLTNTAMGLHHSSGGYLWADADQCYWLDPTKSGTLYYLSALAAELRDMGFDEVVFLDFSFPPTTDILFEGDRAEALNTAAAKLAQELASEEFCVSFLCNEERFRLPEGRTRVYRDNVDGALAQSVAMNLEIPSMEVNLVYLTEAKDTRFDAYGVLRPLPITQLPEVPEEDSPVTPEEDSPEPPEENSPGTPEVPENNDLEVQP